MSLQEGIKSPPENRLMISAADFLSLTGSILKWSVPFLAVISFQFE